MLLAKVTMTSCGIPVEGELGYVPDDEDAEHAGSAAVNDESQTWKVIDPLGSKRIPLRSEDGLVIFDATAMAPNAIVSDSIRRSEQSAKYSVVLYGRDNETIVSIALPFWGSWVCLEFMGCWRSSLQLYL